MPYLDTDMHPMDHKVASARELLDLESFMLIGKHPDGRHFCAIQFTTNEMAVAIANLLIQRPDLIPHFGAAVDEAIKHTKFIQN